MIYMFPDYPCRFGMSNIPQSFLLPPQVHATPHLPNLAPLLQGPHIWVPTITPFGPILVLQVVKNCCCHSCVISTLQPLLPPLIAPPQLPTMRCPAPGATPSFCPWRPWEEKSTSFRHQVLNYFSIT